MREHKRKIKESMATSTATLTTPGVIENQQIKGADHGQSQPIISNENLLVNIKQQKVPDESKTVKLNKNLMKTRAVFDPYRGPVCQSIKKQVSSYYTQTQKGKNFGFQHQQIANSPYHLVKEFPVQQVVR